MFVIKYGELFLYNNANLFTHRITRARTYKSKENAKKWLTLNEKYISCEVLNHITIHEVTQQDIDKNRRD